MLINKVRKWVEMNKAYPYPTIEEPQEHEVYDCFYKNLEYTPYGMKGRIGLGGNRMNYVVVAKAMQGLVNYHVKKLKQPLKSVVLAYDTSHYTKSLAMTAASVLSANSIKVNLFEEAVPAPLMGYAVSTTGSELGIMFSGRHHMADYCGFKISYPKVEIIDDVLAKDLSLFMGMVDPLHGIQYADFKDALSKGAINHLGATCFEGYVKAVTEQSVPSFAAMEKQLKVVYTPYHGTGRQLIEDLFSSNGFEKFYTVSDETLPVSSLTLDEIAVLVPANVFKKSLEMAKTVDADLILATDMTGTRFTAMVAHKGNYLALKSYDITALLNDFAIKDDGQMVEVPTPTYDENVVSWLGDYPVDRDGIANALKLAEMAEFLSKRGLTLCDALERLQNRHGHHVVAVRYIELEGEEGFHLIEHTMGFFRFCNPELLGAKVIKTDYRFGVEEHPPVNMVKLNWSEVDWVAVRPSLFEAKLEFYFSAWGENDEIAQGKLRTIVDKITEILPDSLSDAASALRTKNDL